MIIRSLRIPHSRNGMQPADQAPVCKNSAFGAVVDELLRNGGSFSVNLSADGSITHTTGGRAVPPKKGVYARKTTHKSTEKVEKASSLMSLNGSQSKTQ